MGMGMGPIKQVHRPGKAVPLASKKKDLWRKDAIQSNTINLPPLNHRPLSLGSMPSKADAAVTKKKNLIGRSMGAAGTTVHRAYSRGYFLTIPMHTIACGPQFSFLGGWQFLSSSPCGALGFSLFSLLGSGARTKARARGRAAPGTSYLHRPRHEPLGGPLVCTGGSTA